MRHFEVVRQWCKKTEIECFEKLLISLDHVTYVVYENFSVLFNGTLQYCIDVNILHHFTKSDNTDDVMRFIER